MGGGSDMLCVSECFSCTPPLRSMKVRALSVESQSTDVHGRLSRSPSCRTAVCEINVRL